MNHHFEENKSQVDHHTGNWVTVRCAMSVRVSVRVRVRG